MKINQGSCNFLLSMVTMILFISCHSEGVDPMIDMQQRKDSIYALLDSSVSTDYIESELLESVQKEDRLSSMIYYKILGKRMRSEAQFIESVHFNRKYLEEAVFFNDTLEITEALNNLGTDFRRLSMFSEASNYHYKALNISEQYSKKHDPGFRGYIYSLNGLGNVSLSLRNYNEAESFFREALNHELIQDNNLGKAINYANIGSCFELRNQYDSARYFYNKSLECNIRAGSALGKGLCYTHLGRLHEIGKDFIKAKEQYKLAYDVMFEKTDKWHWLEPVISLARINFYLNNYSDFLKLISQAESTAKEIKSPEHLVQVYSLQSEYYEQKGDYEKAFELFRQSELMQDSTVNLVKANEFTDFRINYEREKGRRQIKSLEDLNLKKEKTNRYTLIIAGLVFCILFFVFILGFYIFRQRTKTNKILKDMERFRSNFYTYITHEFRTPITVIQGLSEQMESKELSRDTQLEYLKSIRRQSNNLLRLVNDIMDISKLKSRVNKPDWKQGNIVVYINMLSETFKLVTAQKDINLVFQSEKEDIEMDFVPFYIDKIINNLMSNAIKNTYAGGEIRINITEPSDDLVSIRVSDTGQGIDEKDLKNIFSLFYQGSNVKTNVGSGGVGLYFTELLVKGMNGTIEVESVKGEGATFIIRFPKRTKSSSHLDFWNINSPMNPIFPSVDSLQSQMGDNDENSMLSDEEKGVEEKYCILIVEDNSDVINYIKTLLQDQYNVILANNGKEALAKASEVMPDIIVSDIMMPEMDGYELCSSIRESSLLNHIPVVLLTAKSSVEDKIQGLKSGAEAYLKKPFDAEELLLLIENILSRRQLLKEKYLKRIEQHVSDIRVESEKDDKPYYDDDKMNFILKVTRIIDENIQNPALNTSFIASQLYMSVSQLNRKLNAIIGCSTSNHIIHIKMKKAKKLLRGSEMNITEIAELCGYYDLPYFSKTFKKMTGYTPTQYQQLSDLDI